MDILEEVVKIAREKSSNSKTWKTLLIVGLIILGIWLAFKFAGKLAPKGNREYIRDMYIPRSPRRR